MRKSFSFHYEFMLLKNLLYAFGGFLKERSSEFAHLAYRYGDTAKAVEKLAQKQVSDLYSVKYPDKTHELEILRRKESRIAESLTFSTLAIYAANRGLESVRAHHARRVAALMRNIGTVSSLDDDIHDEFLVPYFVKNFIPSISSVYELITDYQKVYNTVCKMPPKQKNNSILNPAQIAGASMRVQEFFQNELKQLDEQTYQQIYLPGLNAVQQAQVKDILIAVDFFDENFDGVLKQIEELPGKTYLEKLSELHQKLGIIGSEGAVIVNHLSWVDGKVPIESVDSAYRAFFTPLTKLGQAGIDDAENIAKDLAERSPNIFAFALLPDYRKITVDSLRKYVSQNRKIVSHILLPLVENAVDGIKQIASYGLPREDFDLGLEWTVSRVKKGVKEFESFGKTSVDDSWLRRYNEVRK